LNIHDLIGSIDSDDKESATKKAAELLITAVNDWPTFNQTDLFKFLQEFKNDYGSSLTADKLKNKKTTDTWKEEAKSSIIEMLELDRTKDFDQIIEKILNKYKKG
jgi:hypothetical protein